MTRHLILACALLGLSVLGAPTEASAAPADGVLWTLDLSGLKGAETV